jgi:hypothetical protein
MVTGDRSPVRWAGRSTGSGPVTGCGAGGRPCQQGCLREPRCVVRLITCREITLRTVFAASVGEECGFSAGLLLVVDPFRGNELREPVRIRTAHPGWRRRSRRLWVATRTRSVSGVAVGTRGERRHHPSPAARHEIRIIGPRRYPAASMRWCVQQSPTAVTQDPRLMSSSVRRALVRHGPTRGRPARDHRCG